MAFQVLGTQKGVAPIAGAEWMLRATRALWAKGQRNGSLADPFWFGWFKHQSEWPSKKANHMQFGASWASALRPFVRLCHCFCKNYLFGWPLLVLHHFLKTRCLD
jgi:hypothetical protein